MLRDKQDSSAQEFLQVRQYCSAQVLTIEPLQSHAGQTASCAQTLTPSLVHAVAAGPQRQGVMPGPFTIRAPAGIRAAHLLGFHSRHHHLGPGDPQLAAQAAAAKGAAAVLAPSTQDLLRAAAGWRHVFDSRKPAACWSAAASCCAKVTPATSAVCMHGVAAGQDPSTRLLTG